LPLKKLVPYKAQLSV